MSTTEQTNFEKILFRVWGFVCVKKKANKILCLPRNKYYGYPPLFCPFFSPLQDTQTRLNVLLCYFYLRPKFRPTKSFKRATKNTISIVRRREILQWDAQKWKNGVEWIEVILLSANKIAIELLIFVFVEFGGRPKIDVYIVTRSPSDSPRDCDRSCDPSRFSGFRGTPRLRTWNQRGVLGWQNCLLGFFFIVTSSVV